ncbi:MAG: ABC transporter permease [Candidatus Methylomirabilales bacterium]
MEQPDRPLGVTRWGRFLIQAASVTAFLALWEIIARLGVFPPYLLPAPSTVAGTFADQLWAGNIARLLSHSLRHYALGLVFGVSLGVLLGLCLAWSRRLELVLDPVIALLRPIPPLAWIPFAIIWFGITTQAAAFLISLGAFYITLYSTYGGVKGIDWRLVEVARTLGEQSSWKIVRRVVIPAALPAILTGIRTSLGQGWMTVVAAEMFGIQGIGLKMLEAAGLLAMDVVIAYMAVIGLVYFVIDRTFLTMEARLLRWR